MGKSTSCYIDRSSSNLVKYCLTGKPIAEVVLTVRKAGGNPLEYLKIKMIEVIVSSVHSVGNCSEERIRETVSLSFAKVSEEYIIQNAKGGNGGTVTATFDIKANREV
ncbi:hypothetical protein AGMMS49545_23130 [Betaproteobacteria bacterium]|nr:hypothetical protein AGMMS49545_23130 [Betaproteobacteria bacterium]GHU48552.1 hypothetical protein AGMMS50289_25280 [Betaproteobacteria bacterium]